MARLNTIDRLLVGACAVIWLAVIGVGVAAAVALVELGSGRAGDPTPSSRTPWVLYAIIGISAAIIVASIPLLLRARRAARVAQLEPPRRTTAPAHAGSHESSVAGESPREAPTEKLRVFGAVANPVRRQPSSGPAARAGRYPGAPSAEALDRIWLRAAGLLAAAMGLASLAVMTAAYFMAVKDDDTAWVALAIGAVITAVMPVIAWRQLRALRARVAEF
jgi:hypothetical protein